MPNYKVGSLYARHTCSLLIRAICRSPILPSLHGVARILFSLRTRCQVSINVHADRIHVLTATLSRSHEPPCQVRREQASQGCPHRWMPPHVSEAAGSSNLPTIFEQSNTADCVSQHLRTVQTAVLIETLTALGAEVTWSSELSRL